MLTGGHPLVLTEIDPYAGEETIDIPLDDFQMNPDEGTFDAL